MPARSVCLVTLSLSEAGPGRFGRQVSVTDIYHTIPYHTGGPSEQFATNYPVPLTKYDTSYTVLSIMHKKKLASVAQKAHSSRLSGFPPVHIPVSRFVAFMPAPGQQHGRRLRVQGLLGLAARGRPAPGRVEGRYAGRQALRTGRSPLASRVHPRGPPANLKNFASTAAHTTVWYARV